MPDGGARVGEATAAVIPWPHQVRAFERLYFRWPPRLLIADEVGLGKTIQAGLLLRQAWLAGRARRILILAPKAVLRQWQIELREKFNLNWPIYDGRQLVRYSSPALRGRETLAPGMSERLRVTTDPGYYEEHSESVELWSPGNPLFEAPEFVREAKDDDFPQGTTLKGLLDGAGGRRNP